MEQLQTLEAMGFTMPSPAYLIGLLLFGLIGMAVFYYARKTKRQTLKWISVALMLYPYVISGTAMLYVVGIALCGACYYYRDR